MGLGKKSDQIFVIDFGLAKKFRDPRTSLHIPYTENQSLTGTTRLIFPLRNLFLILIDTPVSILI